MIKMKLLNIKFVDINSLIWHWIRNFIFRNRLIFKSQKSTRFDSFAETVNASKDSNIYVLFASVSLKTNSPLPLSPQPRPKLNCRNYKHASRSNFCRNKLMWIRFILPSAFWRHQRTWNIFQVHAFRALLLHAFTFHSLNIKYKLLERSLWAK